MIFFFCYAATQLALQVQQERTPSAHHFCSAVGAQITSLRSSDLVVPSLPASGCE